jgi:hypothetical protein
MWFYVDHILVSYQISDAAAHHRPRGNLSDLYPRWLGARELLLRGRDPYSPEITVEIQRGYYGRPLDASRPDDPRDRQGFAYPLYVAFLLAPLIGFSFHAVQIFFHWFLIAITAGSLLLWLRCLRWKLPGLVIASCMVFVLGSVPVVQGVKLQQLTLVVAVLIAGSAAATAGGFLLWGGALLALATIKPQLALPAVAWLLFWAVSDWQSRRRLVFGFAAMTALLLVGSETVLPGWWRMFLAAVRQYHQYTQNESVLDQLVNGGLGRYGGTLFAVVAGVVCIPILWRLRRAPAGSGEFGAAYALVLALTVLIVPMYAPYNQVLLLPAILWLVKERSFWTAGSRITRLVFVCAGLSLAWQWIASLGLTALWTLSPAAAGQGWKAPFYATFALPVLVFALAALGMRHQAVVLRVATNPE